MALRRINSKYNVINSWILLSCVFLVLVSGKGGGKRRRQQREPEFVHKRLQNITVYRGETVTLKCETKNLGPKTVVWRKVSEDYPLSVGASMYTQKEEMSIDYKEENNGRKKHFDLVIKKVEEHHSGTYECQIVRKHPKTYHIYLNVLNYSSPESQGKTGKQTTRNDRKWKKKGAIKLTGTEYISTMKTINLTCNATGPNRAPADVDWFHNGHVIHPSARPWKGRTSILKLFPEVPGRSLISELVILHSKPRDAGTYVCRSSLLDTTSIVVHILNTNKTVTKRQGIELEGMVDLPDGIINLTCTVTGTTIVPNYVIWYHDGRHIDTTGADWKERAAITNYYASDGYSRRSRISQLIIKRSTQRDSGEYLCQSQSLSRSIRVDVYVNNGKVLGNYNHPNGSGHISLSILLFLLSLSISSNK